MARSQHISPQNIIFFFTLPVDNCGAMNTPPTTPTPPRQLKTEEVRARVDPQLKALVHQLSLAEDLDESDVIRRALRSYCRDHAGLLLPR